MDWKGVRIWCLCFLVLCPVVFGKENSGKKSQEGTDELKEIPEPSESKIVLVAKDKSQINAFRNERNELSNVSNTSAANQENTEASQIATPVIRKKTRRVLKNRRNGKVLKIQNVTSDEIKTQSSKQSAVSVPNEALKTEESRHRSDISRGSDSSLNRDNDDNDASSTEEKFSPAHFVPSQDFPKKLVSQSRKGSKLQRTSVPVGSGEIRYVLSIDPGSSEETSRSDSSDISSGRFESKRRRNPNFNSRPFSIDLARQPLGDDLKQNQQNNPFPPEAQKVTIVKEKTVHSTSREEEQQRVNIEKNPHHNQPQNGALFQQHQEQRTFPSSQEFGNVVPQNANNQEEKIILIEGTHIPGKNYGPADDTFGFHTNSYKDENTSPQSSNRKKIKVIKVVKSNPDGRIPIDTPLNDHGDGQSRQFFDQQNVHSDKGFDQQHNQFASNEQTTDLGNIHQIPQNDGSHFIPNHENGNAKQTAHVPVQQNFNFDDIPRSNPQINNNGGNNHQQDAQQHVILNITPDPNELYIDENSGELIKFVISDDTSQSHDSNSDERNFSGEIPSQELFSQIQSEPQINVGEHPKGSSQLPQHSVGGNFERQSLNSHPSTNDYENQPNQQQQGIRYIQISGNDDGNNRGSQEVYHFPTDQTSGNQYIQGISDSKDTSEEYIILCDQDTQDYSAEYQSGNSGLNSGANNYQQSNFPQQNQYESSGQSYSSGDQGGYGLNSGNQQQNYGSQEQTYSVNQGNSNNKGVNNIAIPQINTGAQGHYKGSEFSTNIGTTNYNIPQVGSQGNYKGSQSSGNKGSSNYPSPQVNLGAQGHYKGSDFNQGGANFATPQTNLGAQGHYKSTEFSNNKGDTNYAIPQFNTGSQGHYKGSQSSGNKGSSNYPTPQINVGAQGHYKGTDFSTNKGNTNYLIPQVNSGSQGQYKGSGISNNKGISNINTYQTNTGGQGQYKGTTNFVIPQMNIGAQGQYKGSGISNNKGGNNYGTQQNNVAQGHYKGANFPSPQTNVGAQGHYKGANFPSPQTNVGAQGHYKGANFPSPQTNVGAQGHYKGTGFSNAKQNPKMQMPIYREIVTPAYPVGNDMPSVNGNKGTNIYLPQNQGNNKGTNIHLPQNQGNNKGTNIYLPQNQGNNKGTNIYLPQNQGNFKGTGGISAGNYNQGAGLPNQKGYNSGNNAISNNKGYGGGSNKGPQPIDLKGYVDSNAFSNQKYGGNANIFSGNNKGSGIQNQKGYGGGAGGFSGISLQGQNKGSQFPAQKGYNIGNQISSNKGYNSGQNLFPGIKGQNKGSGAPNQKGYNTGIGLIPPQGISKGNDYSNAKGSGGLYNNQRPNLGVQNKGLGNQKGYNAGGQMNLGNQKGYNMNNRGLSNNQNFGGKGYDQGPSLGKGGVNPGIGNQKGYNQGNNLFSGAILSNAHSNNPPISGQKGYTSGNDAFSNNQDYNIGDQFLGSLPLKGGEIDIASLIQKGLEESVIFPSNKGQDLFSGTLGSSNPSKGSGNSNQKGYPSSKNSDNSGYNVGTELFSGAISSKGLNTGLGLPNSKGLNIGNNQLFGNQGYSKPSVSKSFSGYSYPKSSNQGSNNFNQKGYNSGSNAFSGNQGYKGGSNSLSNSKGYQSGANQYAGNSDSFKGIPIKIPQSGSGYDKQTSSVSSHNNFKGTNFNQNLGNSGYGNQNAAGYGGGSASKGINSNQNNNKGYQSGTNQYTDNTGDTFKGIPIQIPQNSGYGKQTSSVSSQNHFKGTDFNQNSGGSDYGNQNTAGYGGGSASKNQQYNAGNNQQYNSGNNQQHNVGNQQYDAGNSLEYNAGNDQQYNVGSDQQYNVGSDQQYNTGNEQQYGSGNSQQYNAGSSQQYSPGNSQQYSTGNSQQYNAGSSQEYNAGNNQEYNAGTSQQYNVGNNQGYNAGTSQQYNAGNDQFGGSYTSNEGSGYQSGQQQSGNQGPVQYIIVEEDIPGQNKGNDQAVYYLQYENDQQNPGKSQEQTYLLLDDSSLQQNQNYRVMVDGGKDRSFPIRQLATVGLHMAKSVLPQMERSKAKSISGKISFGVEIKKGSDRSSESQQYLQSRSDDATLETKENNLTVTPKTESVKAVNSQTEVKT